MKIRFILLATTIVGLNMSSPFASAAETSSYKVGNQRSNLNKTDDFGLGVKLGSLTGLTGKYWTSESRAWDATLAIDRGDTALEVDHLWHFRTGVADVAGIKNSANFIPYVGAGFIAAVGTNTMFFNRSTDNFGLAARLPLGLEVLPNTIRLGVFAEVGLGVALIPSTYTFVNADIGARYYF